MKHRWARASIGVLSLILTATTLHAQEIVAGRARNGGPPPPRRAMQEQRLQARIDSIVRVRLALTDDQFQKMRDVASKVEADRRMLRADESKARMELRNELLAANVNEARIGELLDRMPQFDRRRIELMEQEQRELKRFLSPSQRARYFAVQEELRRTMQEMQRQRLGMDEGPDHELGRSPVGRGRGGARGGGPQGPPRRIPPPN